MGRLLALLFLFSLPAFAGRVVQQTVRTGERAAFTVDLRGGEAVTIELERRGVLVFLDVFDPDGTRLVDGSYFHAAYLPRPVRLVAPFDGTYRLEVKAEGIAGKRGSVTLRISERRTSTASDEIHAYAQTRWVAAERAREESRFDDAARMHEELIALMQRVDDPAAEAHSRYRLGLVHAQRGNRGEALAQMERALEQARDVQFRAHLLVLLGEVRSSSGDYQQALDLFRAGLALAREADDPWMIAEALNSSAIVVHKLGDARAAIERFDEVLAIWKKLGSWSWEAVTANNLARAYADLGRHAESLRSFEHARAILEEHEDLYLLAGLLRNLGGAYLHFGDRERARATFRKGLDIARKYEYTQWELYALLGLGLVAAAEGDHERALALQADALAIARGPLNDRPGELEALYRRATSLRALGRLREAEEEIAKALQSIESTRERVVSAERRATFVAARRAYYELGVDLLMELARTTGDSSYVARAFERSEQARARVFLERLAAARVDVRGGVDAALLAREEQLQREVLAAPAEDGKLARLAAELHDVQGEIERRSPAFARLTRPVTRTAAEVQRDLGAGTLLLEYFVGAERSYVWLVTRDDLRAIELAPRKEIDAAARALNVGWASARPRRNLVRVPARPPEDQTHKRLAALILPFVIPANVKRIVVAADGALQLVPFALLLGSRFEITAVPSASAVHELRQQLGEESRAARTLMVFADPVVAPRLPYTRREAEDVLALVAPKLRSAALGRDATVGRATRDSLRDFRIVHFATHGMADDRHPDRAALRLSDGFLRLQQIYDMRLDADLVVLSACDTGFGPDVTSEGLLTLTRGFMHAGARRVIATLWSVNDRSTAALMRQFYLRLLDPDAPMRPAAALRAAQQWMRESREWRDPYYWAGFVLHGDWR